MTRRPRPKSNKKKKHTIAGWLKEHFIAYAGNNHHPHFFRSSSVVVVLIGVLFLQALYLAQTQIVFKQTNFLSAVLPGALIALANDDRKENGVGMLQEDTALSQIAQKKAEDMAERGYFSHNTPEGHEPWWWLDQAGYQYAHAGENLAVNFSDSDEVQKAWMASPTHRANIVKPVYTNIGIGIATGEYKGERAVFVVQFFATPPPPVVAVAIPTPPTVESVRPEPVREVPPVPIQPIPAPARANPIAERPVIVLGSETPPPVSAAVSETHFFGELLATVTSPKMLLTSALYGFITLILALLGFAALRRFRIPHPGVIVGSVVMTASLIGVLYLNASLLGSVIIPEGTQQSANAISALQQNPF